MLSICLSRQFTILFIKWYLIRQLVITILNRIQHKFSARLFLEIALAIFWFFFTSVVLQYFPENNTNINYKSCPGINIKQPLRPQPPNLTSLYDSASCVLVYCNFLRDVGLGSRKTRSRKNDKCVFMLNLLDLLLGFFDDQ